MDLWILTFLMKYRSFLDDQEGRTISRKVNVDPSFSPSSLVIRSGRFRFQVSGKEREKNKKKKKKKQQKETGRYRW